jgi:chromosome segregation ATPase
MDDIRDTRPWFWILFLLVFAVAVVGLVMAISAKNDSVDEDEVVKEVKAEIKEELAGLNGAIEAANEFQEETSKEAARERKRIKREVATAVAGGEARLNKLGRRVKALEGETSELEGEDTSIRKEVSDLAEKQEALEAEVARINKRLRTLTNEGL